MALQLSDGRYLTVEEVPNPNHVIVRVHKNAEHRARFKEGKELEFEKTSHTGVQITVRGYNEKPQDPEKSIRDNLKMAAYDALKLLSPECQGAIDV